MELTAGLDVSDGNQPALFKPIDSVRFNLKLHLLRRLMCIRADE